MPACTVVEIVPVRTLQKGLSVLAREREWSVDPGSVDGRWGARTRTAFRNIMVGVGCPPSAISARLQVIGALTAQYGVATDLLIPQEVLNLVGPAARRWRHPPRPQNPNAGEPVELGTRPRRSPKPSIIVLALAGVAGVAGLGWWAWRAS